MHPCAGKSSIAALALALAACGGAPEGSGGKPATVEAVAHESELMKITLAPEAERRLGIVLRSLASARGTSTRATFGEVVIPPRVSGGLPVTTATDLAALSASQARADGDIARAAAQARAAQLNLGRAEALVREEAGSVRARDDARAAALSSQADLTVARRQRDILGASVASLGRQGTLWVRVAVLAADAGLVDRRAPARIAGSLVGRPVQAPPSADSRAGSVDFYYAVPNRGLQMGQRVPVDLVMTGGAATGSVAPTSAVVYDIHGGQWVYVRLGPHAYERRRVQVSRVDGGSATIATGLSARDQVVTAGAAELFGTEFGTK